MQQLALLGLFLVSLISADEPFGGLFEEPFGIHGFHDQFSHNLEAVPTSQFRLIPADSGSFNPVEG